MSSDESENDEDYVPSAGSAPPTSGDEDSDEEINNAGDSPRNKKRKVRVRDVHQKAAAVDSGNSQQKTEDELWNEFLGVDSSASSSVGKEERLISNKKDAPDAATPAPAYVESTSVPPSITSDPKLEVPEGTIIGDSTPLGEDSNSADTGANRQSRVDTEAKEQPKRPVPSFGASRKVGASSLLDRIAKDKKSTTLETSRQQWETYKVEEGISEELSTHNKGKGGFLEKKEFLERADYRQYEKERDFRLSRKRKPLSE